MLPTRFRCGLAIATVCENAMYAILDSAKIDAEAGAAVKGQCARMLMQPRELPYT